jgi:hypothetical protein
MNIGISGLTERMRAGLVAIASAAFMMTAHAAIEEAQPQKPQRSADWLDEVAVDGQRLVDLRAAVIASQDRFYELYNQLNDIEEFDIVCADMTPVGRLITRRACATKAFHAAQREEAIDLWTAMWMNESNGNGNISRSQVGPPSVTLAARTGEYKANMLGIMRRNPKLQSLALDAAETEARYRSLQKVRLDGKLAIVQ